MSTAAVPAESSRSRRTRARSASSGGAGDGLDRLDRRQLLAALRAFKQGDFSIRLPGELTGLDGKIADTFNDVIEMNARLAGELARLSRVVGDGGPHLRSAPRSAASAATGRPRLTSVNELIADLVQPTSETARVIGAVARGDLSQTMALDVDGRPLQGEFLRDREDRQHDGRPARVVRVGGDARRARGRHGRQARRPGRGARSVAGTWKDLTDNVNLMAGNLTAQVRNIAEVTTAVANGDLSKKITVDVKGEILELKNTVNTMVDQLSSFAAEVTRVAREVGTEGKLGGQAAWSEASSGTWKDLTDNVNLMAGNLTGQVRNIAGGHDGGRERRPLEEDHRRREGRDPRAQEHDQHDGGPALVVRVRGDARRARGGHGRQARRPGRGEGRGRRRGRT